MTSCIHLSSKCDNSGFTLVEMAMVIVIIGLITGAVLVGRDMISAAAIRAQLSQIEKYKSVVNTFRDKYNGLPGDCKDAANFGFAARGTKPGQGDGNDLLEGNGGNAFGWNHGYTIGVGETAMFWVDLSAAKLIDGTYSTASSVTLPSADVTLSTMPSLDAYFPQARIGRGNYIYVWSGGWNIGAGFSDGMNYFGLSAVSTIHSTGVGSCAPGCIDSRVGLTVAEVASIDRKVDDGIPVSGRVTVLYDYFQGPPSNHYINVMHGGLTTWQVAGLATTCIDNGNVVGAALKYSTQINNGSGLNCALSFRF